MANGILTGIEEIGLAEAKGYGMLAGLVAVEVRPHRVKSSGHWLDKLTYAYRLEDCGETGKTVVYPWSMLRDLAFTYDREYRREFAEHGHICVLDDSTEPFDYTAVSWEKPGVGGMYEVLLATSLDGLYVHLVSPGGRKARVKVTPGELAALVEIQGA